MSLVSPLPETPMPIPKPLVNPDPVILALEAAGLTSLFEYQMETQNSDYHDVIKNNNIYLNKYLPYTLPSTGSGTNSHTDYV